MPSRRCSQIHAELPSLPGLADAGLGLTEGALPDSADVKPSSGAAATNGSSEAHKGQIKVKEERLANSNIRLEVTVPVEMLNKARQKALKQLRAEADIPGFRKGQKVMEISAGIQKLRRDILVLLAPVPCDSMRPGLPRKQCTMPLPLNKAETLQSIHWACLAGRKGLASLE